MIMIPLALIVEFQGYVVQIVPFTVQSLNALKRRNPKGYFA